MAGCVEKLRCAESTKTQTIWWNSHRFLRFSTKKLQKIESKQAIIHPSLNLNLTCVLYLRLIILSVGGDVPVDNDTLLVTDFVNLKIKPTQSFGCAHRGSVCLRVFIEVECAYVYEYLCLYRRSQSPREHRCRWGRRLPLKE
jgi:hypothetical protein